MLKESDFFFSLGFCSLAVEVSQLVFNSTLGRGQMITTCILIFISSFSVLLSYMSARVSRGK